MLSRVNTGHKRRENCPFHSCTHVTAIYFRGINSSISKKMDNEFSTLEMLKNNVEEIYTKFMYKV